MVVPTTYEEYLAELAKNLSRYERLADKATGIDERLDVTNKLLIENLKLLREGLKVQYPPPMFPELPHYNVLKFLLDTARSAPGDKVDMPGDMITAFTDGTLAGTYIRLDSPTADAIPLNEFNPYRLATGWTKFYLETTAQAGKYLRLHVGREASAEASAGTNITAQAVGIYLQPEWAAKVGIDKNFRIVGTSIAAGDGAATWYTVPTGKTLFISGLSLVIYGYDLADRDKNQMGQVDILDTTTGGYLGQIGGNGGCGIVFAKPLAFPAGHELDFGVYNRTNHVVNIRGTVWGYEI